jgi:hypothetical protein
VLRLVPIVEALALIVGVPIAALQLYIGRKHAQAARDLEVILSLSESFRTRWETGWWSCLRRLEESDWCSIGPSDQDELRYMLNWVDWLGNLVEAKHLIKVDVVLNAIGPPMRRMLELGRPVVEKDISVNGPSYWHGLLVMADLLGVRFNGADVASISEAALPAIS